MSVGSRPLVPSRLAPGGVTGGRSNGEAVGDAQGAATMPKWRAFVALTKPRIIELLLITTVPTMVLAQRGWPAWSLVGVTLLGGTLAAGGANAFNMYIDRDIDKLMVRTHARPLPSGAVSPRSALVFATLLEVAAFVVLWIGANLLSAALALGAAVFYVVVYTIWLKRTSRQNIVIGGAAGAVPVLVGWAAVADSLSWPAWLLFGVIFFWTPPHFWALAFRYREDYQAANVPMLPAVVPFDHAVRQMIGHTIAMIACSLALIPVADLGVIYGITAVVIGGVFLASVIWLARRPSESKSMRVFGLSISYVTVLFAAMTLDVLVLG